MSIGTHAYHMEVRHSLTGLVTQHTEFADEPAVALTEVHTLAQRVMGYEPCDYRIISLKRAATSPYDLPAMMTNPDLRKKPGTPTASPSVDSPAASTASQPQ
jgi:hypothetical protein